MRAWASQGQARKAGKVTQPGTGGAFNLKGVLTLFIQNNANMQRRSKSIVVKQRGAAGAGSLPTGRWGWHRLAGQACDPAHPAGEAPSCALCALRVTLCILVKYI